MELMRWVVTLFTPKKLKTYIHALYIEVSIPLLNKHEAKKSNYIKFNKFQQVFIYTCVYINSYKSKNTLLIPLFLQCNRPKNSSPQPKPTNLLRRRRLPFPSHPPLHFIEIIYTLLKLQIPNSLSRHGGFLPSSSVKDSLPPTLPIPVSIT